MITEDNNNFSNLSIDEIVKLRNIPVDENLVKSINNNFNNINKINFDLDTAYNVLNKAKELNYSFGTEFDKNIRYILMCNDKEELLERFNLFDIDKLSRIKDPIIFNNFIRSFNSVDTRSLIIKRKKYIQDTISEYLDFMMYAIDEDKLICNYNDKKSCILDFVSQYFSDSLLYKDSCNRINYIVNNEISTSEELEFYRGYINLKNYDLMGIANFFKTNEYFSFDDLGYKFNKQF